jgi:Na+/H+ antiporter NhaD/arsenite permease-like protein
MKKLGLSGLMWLGCLAAASAQTLHPAEAPDVHVRIYVVVASVLGFLPGVSYLLILIETWMIFSIAHSHHIDNTGEIFLFCVAAGAISATLKTVAHALHLAPVIGQIANSLVAMAFVFALYQVADAHYAHLEQVGRHPDTILQAPQSLWPSR